LDPTNKNFQPIDGNPEADPKRQPIDFGGPMGGKPPKGGSSGGDSSETPPGGAGQTTLPDNPKKLQMMGVFAEFERAINRERVLSGIARAKAEGVVLVDLRDQFRDAFTGWLEIEEAA
jgi:hypothetical protein